VRADVDEVERAARRAAALTSQLLSYARRQMVVPTVVDLNTSVSAMEPMLRRLLGEDVEVVTDLDPDVWPVRVDPGQLEQVLLNLAANARDAMPDGGTVRVRTGNRVLTPPEVRSQPEMVPGEYASLSVSDTGVGMTDEVQSRIFEPFFTTKPPGAGTGLGLAMCYGIAKQADGHIMVESAPGQGTRMTLLLPRVPAALSPAVPSAAELPRGTETILVTEDDAVVRMLTARTLRELGYTVVQASDGNQALAVWAVQPLVDLLFTDVVMPDMNGRQLAQKALEAKPDLKVLYTTGYTRNAIIHHGRLDPDIDLLTKPFTADALARKVRRILDGGAKQV
jgi:CheY-like chemotaxis protein